MKSKSEQLEPAELELTYADTVIVEPEPLTKEKVETSVTKRLSKKTDKTKNDPFVPQVQLEEEVKQVAQDKGFPLSRGTEIGARLLARSKRSPL